MGAISMKISSRLSRVESLMNQGLYWRLLWTVSSLCLRKVWLVATRSVIISIAITKHSLCALRQDYKLLHSLWSFYHFMEVNLHHVKSGHEQKNITTNTNQLEICYRKVPSFISQYFYLSVCL